jgi:hypothetical protein
MREGLKALLCLVVMLAGLLVPLRGIAADGTRADPEDVMKFAPESTDIVFRADIDSLTQFLRGAQSVPPAQDALRRLEELRSGMGIPGVQRLDIAVVYTFHLRGTDAHLVILELGAPPPAQQFKQVPKALRSKLAVINRCGQHFVLLSKVKNLVQKALEQAVGSCGASGTLRLSQSLQQSVREQRSQHFWAALDLTEDRRQLIHDISGSPSESIEPQLSQLQHITAVVRDLEPNSLTLELVLQYPSSRDVESLKTGFAGSLPFPDDGRTIQQEENRIRVTQRALSFADLNAFLSRF